MLLFIAISEFGGRLISHFSLHLDVNVGQQVIPLGSMMTLLVGSFVGALVAERYFLVAAMTWYVLIIAFAIHMLQRVGENLPDAPTHLDVLMDTHLTVLLGIATIMMASLTCSTIKRCVAL